MKTECFVCGNKNEGLVYLRCIHEGQEKLVCVKCLPMLIHGAH